MRWDGSGVYDVGVAWLSLLADAVGSAGGGPCRSSRFGSAVVSASSMVWLRPEDRFDNLR
jgi:hypothetical protein